MTEKLLLLGPPGTGKTTRLLSELEARLKAGVPPSRVAFVSFTRSAVRDAIRLVEEPPLSLTRQELPYFRTLHSLCFFQLSLRRNDVFGREALAYLAEITGEDLTGKMELEAPTLGERGDALLFIDQLARSTLTPLEEAWRAHDTPLDWFRLKRFADAYAVLRQDLGLVDFTNMLERYLEEGQPVDVDIAFCDEAQDFTPLQWKVIEKAFGKVKELIVSGDDDQCQPAGTIVETTLGPCPIEDLDDAHRLLFYQREESVIRGHAASGSTFSRGERYYSGRMYELSAGDKKTSCTKDHLWYVRWTEDFKKSDANVVYIMKKGDWFRVGHCKAFRVDSVFHVGARANAERADAVWILKILPDKRSGYVYEQIVATTYGIPQTPFHPVNGREGAVLLNMQTIQEIFDQTDSKSGAMKALESHGLMIDKPFIDKRKENYSRYGSNIFEVVGCNLQDGVMQVPVYDRTKRGYVSWEVLNVSWTEVIDLKVYSLKVDRYPTYIADGIATHNCLYKWAGASATNLLEWPHAREVLSQSYRLPRKIWQLANEVASQITKRWEKAFLPLDREGTVEWLGRPDEVDLSALGGWVKDVNGKFNWNSEVPGTWLLLARTRRQLTTLVNLARDQGVVHSVMGKNVVDVEHVKQIQDYERVRAGDPTIPLWHDALTDISIDEREFLLSCLRRGESLTKTPRVRIETVHGAKGLEADNVLFLTDINARVRRGMELDPDAEQRVLYVAVTRAREALYLVTPQRSGWGYQL